MEAVDDRFMGVARDDLVVGCWSRGEVGEAAGKGADLLIFGRGKKIMVGVDFILFPELLSFL
jgi:hypothetical protein